MAKKQEEVQKLPHEYFPPINFTPAGPDNATQQGTLIQLRQSPFFTFTMALLAETVARRSDLAMLDYTRDAVSRRIFVDGFPYELQPQDRQTGDGMLACLKKLANLNPTERRAKQEGRFTAECLGGKYNVFLTTQGVPTGERVVIKFAPKKFPFATLEDIGMRDKMRDQFKSIINRPEGLVVFSAPPSGGLTTLWKVGLEAADRFVRDFVLIEDKASTDEEIININSNKFDAAAGETPMTILPKILLKQPDTLVVPELMTPETAELMCKQINDEHKMAITRVQARDAVEALLRVMQTYKIPAADYAKALTMVVNQRLIRKLCDCKQPYAPPPQLLQKLGIPPGRVQQFFREWQPPPPPPPDQKGKVEEPQICRKCGGIGYYGRTAIIELLEVNDAMRDAIVKSPQPEVLRQVARQAGCRTIQEEGVLLVVKGTVSLTELQRVLK
jgi:type II secretory ATPase GspE/PulE/Tfp pilus assembly ATPase PilB-like protein